MSTKVLSSLGEEIVTILLDFGFLLSRVKIRRGGEDGRENSLFCMEVGYRKMHASWASEIEFIREKTCRGGNRWWTCEKKVWLMCQTEERILISDIVYSVFPSCIVILS